MSFEQLYEQGVQYFEQFVTELRAYDVDVAPELKVYPSRGMQYYYDLNDSAIYIAAFDTTTTAGKLAKIFLRSLLYCQTDEELIDFLSLFQSRIIAHELGHHLRHRYGVFDKDNLWLEEQIANQLAIALTRHRLAPEERERAKFLLKRAMEGLSNQIKEKGISVSSHYNILVALSASGELTEDETNNIEIIRRVFQVDPGEVLKFSGQLSLDIANQLENRNDVIDHFNEDYTADMIQYMYYHLGWLYYDLNSQQTHYIDEFVQLHLGQPQTLLSVEPLDGEINERAIHACYTAYRRVYHTSETLRRYFYKRYRNLLITRLGQVHLNAPVRIERLLEQWDENESDSLSYIALLAPALLQNLLPNKIDSFRDMTVDLPEDLPSVTDRRLWEFALELSDDPTAELTLERLRLLDNTLIYRDLPVEMLLELAQKLYRVHLQEGDTIIWEGERNDDVYILVTGELKISVQQGDTHQSVALVDPGDVFGEMAFFTQSARSASVIATMPSEVLALKEADLRLLTYKYPAILHQMARTIAQRLDDLNRFVSKGKHTDTLLLRVTKLND